MNFEEEKKDNTWDTIIILAGIAFLVWLFKSRQESAQPIQSQQYQNAQQSQEQYQPLSTYENAEEWEIVRGDDGHISNLKVGRNATIGNGFSHEKYTESRINGLTESDLENKIKQMMIKNMQDIQGFAKYNNRIRIDDETRKRRFGFN